MILFNIIAIYYYDKHSRKLKNKAQYQYKGIPYRFFFLCFESCTAFKCDLD